MTPINHFRLEALLDSLMARVRPAPSCRERCDVSYRMADALFIIDITTSLAEGRRASMPYLKAVSVDEGVTWRLFEHAKGQWEISPHHGAFMDIHALMQRVEELVITVLASLVSEVHGHAA